MEHLPCPCGSAVSYSQCCERYHLHCAQAPTPEALMRSRYSACAMGLEQYLYDTLVPHARAAYDAREVQAWLHNIEWLGLEIVATEAAVVEFKARYRMHEQILEHHEVSTFEKHAGCWYFAGGIVTTHELGRDLDRGCAHTSVGRNDPCPCGSGKKFKKCCGK